MVEIFYKVRKGSEAGSKAKNIAIARRARHKFEPEFPRAALALVVGLVSVCSNLSNDLRTDHHLQVVIVLGEHKDGLYSATNLRNRGQETVLYYFSLINRLYDHPVYGPQLRIQLTKISQQGRYVAYLLSPAHTNHNSCSAVLDAENSSMSNNQPSSMGGTAVNFDLSVEDVFGYGLGSSINQ